MRPNRFEWLPLVLLGAALFFMRASLVPPPAHPAQLACADGRADVQRFVRTLDRFTKQNRIEADAWLWTWNENPDEQFLFVFRSDEPRVVLIINLAKGCETPIPAFGGKSYHKIAVSDANLDALAISENVFTTGRDMRPKPETF